MTIHPTFIKPQYNAQSFADLPNTLTYWLTGQGEPQLASHIMEGFTKQYDRVIFLFIDGFGWRYINRYIDKYPFLQRFQAEGKVSQLTSMFPSTTAAHVTCIHTGLPPARSGIFEWQYYDPIADHIICPLRYAFNAAKQWHSLDNLGLKPKHIYPPHTIYQALARYGVTSHVFQSAAYATSPYSTWVCREATMHPFITATEALVNLRHLLATEQAVPSYYILYFSMIDSIGHHYGPPTEQVEAEIDTMFTTLERIFMQGLTSKLLCFCVDITIVQKA